MYFGEDGFPGEPALGNSLISSPVLVTDFGLDDNGLPLLIPVTGFLGLDGNDRTPV